MPTPRGVYWCWTLNNYTPEELSHCRTLCDRAEDVTYVCFSREVGDSGTPHLQGYLELAAKLRLGGLRKLDGLGRAHLELRKGTQAEAIDYCRKDGNETFEEHGTRKTSSQGKRMDLEAVKALLDGGAPLREVADQHFGTFVRYGRGIAQYQLVTAKKRARDVSVHVLWGAPGVGKTRWIFERHADDLWICNDPTLQWFDGYQGESVVLIDDFRGEASPAFMLRLLDRYPLQVPIKGGFTEWRATTIYITSNVAPPFGMESIVAPLARRLSIVQELPKQEYDITEAALNEIFN
ncbi:replication-associated protein [Circoviridae 11 LDMD-2013]|uniref:replication-associated protein n=1 Tax=Circoviridae 11 LDMD-2013 TaxID=1379715 RepID=UPI0003846DFD|nr:replication-associated protein [Circoviridae 11 LDMD-2013]AGS36210.1 replication-associated protein [Circoviridae 11 LDMD-2013]